MAGIADFTDDLFGGAQLVFLSLILGGVVCALFVLRPLQGDPATSGAPVDVAIRLVVAGAAALVPTQLVHLALKAEALSGTIGRPVYGQFFATGFAHAALIRTGIAALVVAAGLWLSRAPRSQGRWALVGALSVAVAVAGAWLSHGASRFEDRAALMGLTALHAAAAAVWVGGVALLVVLWRVARREPRYRDMWPLVLRRFAAVGAGALAVIAVTGLPLGISYVADLGGLVGTGYGAMVVTKTALLAVAMGLAFRNFHAARARAGGSGASALRTETPYTIETEFLVLVVLLLSAASLSSQPPAVDIVKERATWSQVVEVFAPKPPHLTTPSIAEISRRPVVGPETVSQERTIGDEWSDFNHNISGVFVIVAAVMSLLARVNGFGWCRHWPLAFSALGAFLFFRTDPETWPIGPVGFVDSFKDAEVMQHHVALLLAIALGVLEWRARTSPRPGSKLPYVFPILVALGGVLLLTHSHTAFEIRSQFLVQVSHTAMGFLAVVLAAGRWLELRLQAPAAAVAGTVGQVAMLLVGIILLFYTETIV
jgi:putative copper resistance protein D